ncbi:MAG: hypothetical protein V7L00_10580 [Nostoc sp.]|uniref:hypothetical protein n=1 Tax=Nostoc sp. TaxID=1180 RepID=UPI002FF88B74
MSIITNFSLFLFLCVAPFASPLALASPFGRRGDAARTSRGTRRQVLQVGGAAQRTGSPTHWLLCASAVRYLKEQTLIEKLLKHPLK